MPIALYPHAIPESVGNIKTAKVPLSVLNTKHQCDWSWQNADRPLIAMMGLVCIMSLKVWLVASIDANAVLLGNLFDFGNGETVLFMNQLIVGKVVVADRVQPPDFGAIDSMLGR